MPALKYTLLDLDFPAGHKNKTAVLVEGDTEIMVLADAFPTARILATPLVIDHIKATCGGKLVAWAASGANLPTRLPEVTPLRGDLEFAGHTLHLKGGAHPIPDRHWFFEPEQRVVLGGVLLFQDQHVWVADSPEPAQHQAWIAALDDVAAHTPSITYPGHRIPGGALDRSAIAWTRDYLVAFDKIVTNSATAEEATACLTAEYPEAGLLVAAQLSPKVVKGELEWH